VGQEARTWEEEEEGTGSITATVFTGSIAAMVTKRKEAVLEWM
jgi:hypothetical protein